MSSEKRLLLFLVLTFCTIFGMQYVMDLMGLNPPPVKKRPPIAIAKAEPGKPAEAAKDQDQEKKPAEVVAGNEKENKAPAPEPAPPAVASKKGVVKAIDPRQLVLGSAADKSPKGYRLEVQLEQNGAGVSSVASSRYEAEFVEGKNLKRHRPLQLLQYDPKAPPSLTMSLVVPNANPPAADEAIPQAELPLDQMLWEVVPDDQTRIVRPIPADAKPRAEKGQEVVFRASVGVPEVTLTKRYRLMKDADGFEVELGFESPEKEQSIVYKLLGPHGIPIEGEWYTGTFRDVFFGQVEGKKVKIVTKSGYDIAKGKDNPERFQALPLKFAGVENQYFASFVEPDPTPPTPEARWDSEAIGVVIHEDRQAMQKADVAVQITSKPVKVGPNVPVTHKYKVFAGPKTSDALQPYGAEALASYRKSNWIPFSSEVASVISPLLDHIYELTRTVAGLFGFKKGNYGVAIILLTLLVRLMMFPLGRKQAIAAKKMQDLQPYMKEVQEKYKDDKEQQQREIWALYKRHGVNPLGGCLPALIQMPIFVGLWQALNNSVHLRHANFLYIENLAAPDMLFRFPVTVPLLGDYFNLLPFLVVALMLVQTKLFSPPPTTPEAEMQQKMMKYMMIFMAFMFYKVPSGLGIYFITSSLWQISERLLLPKVTHVAPTTPDDLGDEKTPPGGGRGGPGGGGGNGAPPKPPGRLAKFWEKVMQEASKDPTYRKLMNESEKDKEKEKDRDRPKPRRDRAAAAEGNDE